MSDNADHVVLDGGSGGDAVKRSLAPGRTVFVEGWGSLFVLDAEGDVDELSPDEHAEWVDVGTTHGRPQSSDEIDVSDDDFLNSRVGRIGSIYFEQIIDPWTIEWLGTFESDEAALESAAGADFDISLE